jgi:hypothetical protein
MRQRDGIHTIPVPLGWSVEQAWEAIAREDTIPDMAVTWTNVAVKDGRLVMVVDA